MGKPAFPMKPASHLSWQCRTYEQLDARNTADEADANEPRPEWPPYQQALQRTIVELIKYGRQKLRRSIN